MQSLYGKVLLVSVKELTLRGSKRVPATSSLALGKQYVSYSQALLHLNIESLESRRRKLCLRFALKAEKHPKFSRWFKPVRVNVHPRTCKPFKKYQDVFAYTGRAAKSLLNFYYNNEMKKKKSIYLIIFLEGEL